MVPGEKAQVFNMGRGKQSGEKGEKTRKGKSWEGRKDSEWQRTQEMLFGGKVRREKTKPRLVVGNVWFPAN